MASQLSICNSALSKLGCSRINNFDDHTVEGEAAMDVYDELRQELLSMHPWHFATRQTWLFKRGEPGDPPLDYPQCADYRPGHDPFAPRVEYAHGPNVHAPNPHTRIYSENRFPLPADCLKVDSVEEGRIKYRIEGREILCYFDRIFLRYIADIQDPNVFDATFITVFTYRLAKELAWKLTGSASLTDQMDGFYERALREARLKNAREGTPEQGFDYTFLASRCGFYR